MLGFNGGLMGVRRTSTTGAAAGLWFQNEQSVAKRANIWPTAIWTPAEITTSLWLDAADATTVTTVSGAVSQWNDKSGNARHASQSTAANRPSYPGTALNSKSTVDFDGTNDVLTATLATGLSDSYAVFAVVVPRRNQQIEGYVVSEVASYSNYWFLLGRGGSGGQKMGISMFDGSNNPLSDWATLPTLDAGYIMCGIRDTTTGSRKLFYYQDATLRGDVTDDTSLTAPTYSNLQIGGQVNQSDRYGQVRIGEVVIVPSLLSTTTRQLIEGYLAHKWGLASSIPSDHPYKNSAPTI